MKRKKHRKPLTPYERCLKQEKDRLGIWRKTEQGKFESEFLSFEDEEFTACKRHGVSFWLSDNGRGARIVRNLGGPTVEQQKALRLKRIDWAKHRIARKAPDCMQVFWLVLKNINNREESIWQMIKDATPKKPPNGRLRKPSIGTR